MLGRLHTLYKIIHCVALNTLCGITQKVSNYYAGKFHWQISGMFNLRTFCSFFGAHFVKIIRVGAQFFFIEPGLEQWQYQYPIVYPIPSIHQCTFCLSFVFTQTFTFHECNLLSCPKVRYLFPVQKQWYVIWNARGWRSVTSIDMGKKQVFA